MVAQYDLISSKIGVGVVLEVLPGQNAVRVAQCNIDGQIRTDCIVPLSAIDYFTTPVLE